MSVSTNNDDGSCWLTDPFNDCVVHLSRAGSEIYRNTEFAAPAAVAVDPRDGSWWVTETDLNGISHFTASGSPISRTTGFLLPRALSVDYSDGSCWVADTGNGQVVHLASNGSVLFRGEALLSPLSVSVNPGDHSCWVADTGGDRVVHLSAGGELLSESTGFATPSSVSVNPLDGTCWVADTLNDEVVRLADDGAELARKTGFSRPSALSVDALDGFVWVADTGNDRVVRLSPTGFLVGERGGFFGPQDVSANSGDGSCWVADTLNGQVVRVLVTKPAEPRFPDVPFDAFGHDEILALVDANVVAGFPDGLFQPDEDVARDQMAVFIARALAGGDENVPDLVGEPTFADVPADYWALDHIEYVYERDIVQGYGGDTYRPLEVVSRAQMAAFLARSVVTPTGEDGLVDYTPPAVPSFADVDTGFWAYRYVEFIVQEGIARGFADGLYHPEVVVSRAMMAVFIHRAFFATG
jgi:DNA-binding beta-propeller fold protein YncE